MVWRFGFAIGNLKPKIWDSGGGHSSMVEPQIVVLVVAGSSPVGHPAYEVPNPKAQTPNNHFIWSLEPGIWDFKLVPVAQPDRASDFGSEGWGFESLQARHSLVP